MNNIVIQLVFSWLVPGAGHWLKGNYKKAVFFFVIINFTMLLGIYLADFRDIHAYENPFYFLGRFGSGWVIMFLTLLTGFTPLSGTRTDLFEVGSLYICVASLLNLLVMMNISAQVKTGPEAEKTPAVQPADDTRPIGGAL